MTTPVTSLAPTPTALPEQAVAAPALNPATTPEPPAPTPPAAEPSAFDKKLGTFIYNHRDVTTRPVGHVGYQMLRNLTAAVPYGLATAGVWHGFEKLTQKTANATSEFGKGVNGLARSPVRDIAMIAAGFTFYRGTLRFVRYTKERLFNPENTLEQSISEVQNFGKNAADTIKEIAPAEVNSTPYGAIALGLGRRYLDGIPALKERPPEQMIKGTTLGNHAAGQQRMLHFMRDGKFAPHLVGSEAAAAKGITPAKEWLGKVFGKSSRGFTEAGVFVLSFLSFFELSDRLYKDVQVRRGIWKGEQNSLIRVQPRAAEEKETLEHEAGLDKDFDYQQAKHPTHTETFGKSDPNLLRLGFVRVLPTVLGIGAYTFTKRAAYASMGHFTAKDSFAKRATVEGLATATFFVMTTAADTFEGLWKKLVEPKPTTTLTPEQQRNYDALLARVNDKHAQQGRAA
ncbi:MAG: hypothetical protein DI582_07660 [Azospirillum brasilense]|nr:MAG: hypothetical protein DI582_07660 [Azospirillum brasilense]